MHRYQQPGPLEAVAHRGAVRPEAYRGYWAAKVASYADPSQPQDPDLAVYAVDTTLTDTQATIGSMGSASRKSGAHPRQMPDA